MGISSPFGAVAPTTPRCHYRYITLPARKLESRNIYLYVSVSGHILPNKNDTLQIEEGVVKVLPQAATPKG